MYSKKLYTPLRYPGGKSRFAPYIAELMQLNGIEGGHYLEPYAGGAGVALELLFHGHAKHIHINDFDPAVNAFWVSVTQNPDGILRLLNDTPVTMDQWFKWRSILNGVTEATILEQGFATLFMNRTNRSGILKAGVIGGKAQAGDYQMDARFKKDVLSKRIMRIAENAKNISVYKEDALLLLSRAKEFLPMNSLTYLDPPYYVKGQGLYRNFYAHDDHEAIANLIQARKFQHKWVVSYDAVDQIKEMYKLSKQLTYDLNYTAQRKYVGNEVMFFSKTLKIPMELDVAINVA